MDAKNLRIASDQIADRKVATEMNVSVTYSVYATGGLKPHIIKRGIESVDVARAMAYDVVHNNVSATASVVEVRQSVKVSHRFS